MKMLSKRLLCLLLCLCMVGSWALPAHAAQPEETATEQESQTEELPQAETEPQESSEPEDDTQPTEEPEDPEGKPGKFALAVLTSEQIVIAPTWIEYAAGQTIAQALLSSDYNFQGLLDDEESYGWIEAVEGVVASYSLFFDDNRYDLTERADTMTALCLTERVNHYSEAYLDLIKAMAVYNAGEETGLQGYSAAQKAYAAAETELYTADEGRAEALCQDLEAAIAAYEKHVSGESYTLTVLAPGATQITLNGEFGDTYAVTFQDDSQQVTGVLPGSYEFDLNDGGQNHVIGTIAIQDDTTLEAELPSGQWLKNADFGYANGAAWTAVKKLDEWTFLVPDYAGPNLYPNLLPGDGVDHKVCKMYWDDKALTWDSRQKVMARSILADSMEGTTLTLEARQELGDYTQVQTYEIAIVRSPSLAALNVYAEGTKLPLEFDCEVPQYQLSTTGNSLDLYPQALCDGTTTHVNGTPVEGDSAHVQLQSEENTIVLEVSHENGQSSQYTLTVNKLDSVKVKVQTAAESVEVYNAAGSSIQPVDGSYALVPGETYTYITTSMEYFHTSGSFVAAQNLTVKAPAPDTEDALESLAAYSANRDSAKLDVDREFDPACHTYTYQTGSNETGFGLKAALNDIYKKNDYTVTAYYKAQSSGQNRAINIKNNFTTCILFLEVSGVGNTMNLRISKTVDDVQYYQDYVLTAQRKLQLNDLQLSAGDEPVVLNYEEKTGFLKFNLDYTAEVGQTLKELQMNLKLFSKPSDNQVRVTVSADAWSQELDYSEYPVDEYRQVTIALDPEKQQQTIEIRLEREGATTQIYRIVLDKLPPVETVFDVDPADALVHLRDDVTGRRILPEEGGTFILNTSRSYTYVITRYGYVTATDSFVAGEQNQKITVNLTKAPENNLEDIELDTDFASFRGNENNNGITNAKTPILAEEAVLNWAVKLGSGVDSDAVGSPILVGGELYTYAGSTIFRLDKDTGEILSSAPMDHPSSFSITPPAYGEGMIFVALSNGGIQAFNAKTLESLWLYTDELGGQPNCPLVYRNGYLYTGFWNSEVKDANFVCICVTDEDPSQEKENKLATWAYTHNGGFYWAGAYVSEEYLLVTTDDGNSGYITGHGSIISIDPATGVVLDSLTMPGVGDLRTSVCYDDVTDAYYFASKGGDFYRVQVNADGTFREDSLKRLHLDNGSNDEKNPPMCTSTPVVYNGRAYVGVSGTGQFVTYSGHNITVIDLKGWKIAYKVPTQGYPQTSGLLTTAYENETQYVYVYFFDNFTPGKLRVLRDTQGQNTMDLSYSTTEEYTKSGKNLSVQAGYVLFTPSGAQEQYAICSPIVDAYGNLFFKNDSGYLMSLGSVVTKLEIQQQPDTRIYEVGQIFDGTGMQVVATYANGMTRDVTEYVTYSQEALTVDDTELSVSLKCFLYQNKDGETGVEYFAPTTSVVLTINTDHTWDEGTVTKEANCVEDGEMTFTCPVCHETKKEPIPANGNHIWDDGEVTKKPTEKEPGVMTFTCTVCGDTKEEGILPTGEHDWDEGVVTKEPTCGSSGIKTFTCIDCGETKAVEMEPTGAHSWDKGTVTTAPTCITNGEKCFTCTVCGQTKKLEIEASGAHNWDQGTVIKAPSVIAEGKKVFTCSACGKERTEVLPKLAACTGGSDCPEHIFTDAVAKDFWSHAAIDYVTGRGLMNGMGNGKFEPQTTLTRGMLVTILWRYAGSEDVGYSTFQDVDPKEFYAKAVAWAAKYGIVDGMGNNKFCPKLDVTREQIATIFYRFTANNLKEDVSQKGSFAAFQDGAKVQSYAVEPMKWAVASGLLSGSKDNGKLYLRPDSNALRAEAAQMIMNYIELVLA